MKILILGGTGAMGVPLTKILTEQGHRVVVTSRQQRQSDNPHLVYLQGNAKDYEFVKRITESDDFDVIVDFMSYSTTEFRERYIWMLGHTQQYVFISSARVFAECKTKITEDSPRLLDVCTDKAYLATDEYALAKARQEDLLHTSGRQNFIIIRPSITYNDYRLQMGAFDKEDWLYRALHGRSIVTSLDVADKLTAMTHGADLTRALSCIIGRSEAMGRTFNIACEKSYTWNEILGFYLDVLQEVTGSRPKVCTGRQSIKMKDGSRYQIMYARSLNRQFDCSAIKEFASIDSFIDPQVGVKTALHNFLKAPRFDAINWRHEAWNDRVAGERTPLGEIPTRGNRLMYLSYRYNLPVLYRIARRVVGFVKR